MNVVLVVLAGLIIMPIVIGWMTCYEMTFSLEISKLNSPFYKIGIFSERFFLPEDQIEDEVIIGLFFINIVFTFWRVNEEEDFQA
jgi:hypothetical protein